MKHWWPQEWQEIQFSAKLRLHQKIISLPWLALLFSHSDNLTSRKYYRTFWRRFLMFLTSAKNRALKFSEYTNSAKMTTWQKLFSPLTKISVNLLKFSTIALTAFTHQVVDPSYNMYFLWWERRFWNCKCKEREEFVLSWEHWVVLKA